MTRIAMLGLALMVSLLPTSLRGQDVTEVNRLKARIQLLETQLKSANRKIDKLQAENEKLKAGTAASETKAEAPQADPLAEGTSWKGTYKLSLSSPPKTYLGSATVTVLERGDRAAKLSVSYEGWPSGRSIARPTPPVTSSPSRTPSGSRWPTRTRARKPR